MIIEPISHLDLPRRRVLRHLPEGAHSSLPFIERLMNRNRTIAQQVGQAERRLDGFRVFHVAGRRRVTLDVGPHTSKSKIFCHNRIASSNEPPPPPGRELDTQPRPHDWHVMVVRLYFARVLVVLIRTSNLPQRQWAIIGNSGPTRRSTGALVGAFSVFIVNLSCPVTLSLCLLNFLANLIHQRLRNNPAVSTERHRRCSVNNPHEQIMAPQKAVPETSLIALCPRLVFVVLVWPNCATTKPVRLIRKQ